VKPFIARDTKQPLVIFGGYHVGEDGSIISQAVSNQPRKTMTVEDYNLLQKHGIEGLEKMQLYGVLDRIDASTIIALKAWNVVADQYNQWDQLGWDEKLILIIKASGIEGCIVDDNGVHPMGQS
jgi:hypothetical protein